MRKLKKFIYVLLILLFGSSLLGMTASFLDLDLFKKAEEVEKGPDYKVINFSSYASEELKVYEVVDYAGTDVLTIEDGSTYKDEHLQIIPDGNSETVSGDNGTDFWMDSAALTIFNDREAIVYIYGCDSDDITENYYSNAKFVGCDFRTNDIWNNYVNHTNNEILDIYNNQLPYVSNVFVFEIGAEDFIISSAEFEINMISIVIQYI